MNQNSYQLKASFIEGLNEVVENEINLKTKNLIISKEKDCFYLDFNRKLFTDILKLKSVGSVSLVLRGDNYNPGYLSKHKSILGDMIHTVFSLSPNKFKTFRISCAGSDSDEMKSIHRFIETEFDLEENSEADLKINIFKSMDMWEISIQTTSRPLSLRDYRVVNMSGGMDSTVAFALNYYCELGDKRSYLNPFSGSSTLLIEAALEYNNLEILSGFDIDKKNLTSGYQNVQNAGLIKKIKLLERDIFKVTDLGKFDAIVSDLPFGMVISKNENLDALYNVFINFSYDSLEEEGVMAVYTSEADTFVRQLDKNKWRIIKKVDLKKVTNVNSYLYPQIIICKKV